MAYSYCFISFVPSLPHGVKLNCLYSSSCFVSYFSVFMCLTFAFSIKRSSFFYYLLCLLPDLMIFHVFFRLLPLLFPLESMLLADSFHLYLYRFYILCSCTSMSFCIIVYIVLNGFITVTSDKGVFVDESTKSVVFLGHLSGLIHAAAAVVYC